MSLSASIACFIDWGLAGELDRKELINLTLLMGTIATGNTWATARALSRLDSKGSSMETLRAIVTKSFARGGTLPQRFQRLMVQAQASGIGVSSNVILASKSILQADGLAREIDPNFQPRKAGFHFLTDWGRAALRERFRAKPAPVSAGATATSNTIINFY